MSNRRKLTSRITSILLAIAMVVTSIQLSAFDVSADVGEDNEDVSPASRAVTQQELNEAFVVKNGTFAYGMDGWETFAMIWEGYDAAASFNRVEEGICVNITNTGEAGQYAGPWTVALNQPISVLCDETYTLSFDATSTIDRTIHSGIQEGKVENDSFVNGDLSWIEATELKAGEIQHVERDITINTRDISGNFVIQMGAKAPGDGWTGEHSVTLSNIRLEKKGAREQYIVVTDPDFTDTDKFDLTGGVVELPEGGAGNCLNFSGSGSIAYKGIQLQEGVTYAATFAGRTPFNAEKKANVKATITYADGEVQEIKTEEVEKYTVRYRENFTALKSGEATLTLTTDGTVLMDNIGVWVAGVADALGAVFPRANIMGLSFALESTKVVLGEDVVLNASSASGLGIPEDRPMVVKIDGEEISSDKYHFQTVSVGSDKFQSTLTIDKSVFTEPDRYAVSLEVGGYENAESVFVTILPADGNLIENGNFENGFSNWSAWFNDRYSGNANMTDDYRVAINMEFFLNWYDESGADRGPVDWSTQLQTPENISVEAGKTYTLSFKASSTVERPIAVSLSKMDQTKKWMVLGTEEQTFTETFTATETGMAKLQFLLGQFPENEFKYPPFTSENFVKHTMYFTDVSLVDASRTEEYKKMPSIIGVNEGKTYKAPVSAKVNYKANDYTIVLTRNGQVVPYTEGTEIKEDGEYVITVTDKDDATITATKRFTVAINLDYDSKEYLVIANKSTEKVIEAGGTKPGRAVIQSAYAGRASQFFSLDVPSTSENPDAASYVVIRSLATDMVIDVEGASKGDGAQLILNEYNGNDSQLWKVDETVHQGFVKFINKGSGLVINVSGASKTEGLPLNQSANTGNGDEGQQSTDGQRWDIIRTINVREAIEGKKVDVSTSAAWQENAIVTPIANELNPAGQITTEFYPLEGATSYDIYFDGEKTYTITKDQLDNAKSTDEFMITEDGTIKLFNVAYSVEVAKHTFYIQANTGVKTNEIEIFLSKKGVGWATLHRTENMNLSWYYHWATGEALGTDEKLTFVPMLWGNYGDEWQKDPANKRYGTVLSFNEPDWSDQSNVPVSIELAQAWADRYNAANPGANRERPASVEEAWQSFMDSGLRIGSPATAIAAPYCNGSVTMNDIDGPDRWWYDFMDLMDANSEKGWDYDFVAIHSYDAGCSAKGFLKMIDDTYALTGKPIWITEFGVAEWNDNKVWKGGNPQTQQQVIEFMTEVINGLEERDYVEHYAWFPFDPNDDYGGASGIFDYETGKLNALGQVYAQLGLPEGYEVDKQYDTEVPKIANIKATQTTLEVGEIANVTVGNGKKVSAWTSLNPNVITVDSDGNVEAVKEGNATVRVETEDGAVGSLDFTVKNPELESVTIRTKDGSEFNQLLVGEEKVLTFDTVPNKGLSDSAGEWKSSNASVVRIDSNRKITASKPGVSLITVTVAGTTGYAIVTVYDGKELPSEKAAITKPSNTMVRGETMKLDAVVTPAGTQYTWKSYTENIATVDSNGTVTANAVGTALIAVCVKDVPVAVTAITVTAKKQSGGIKVTKVTINPLASSVLYVGDSAVLSTKVEPSNATDPSVTYKSSAPDVASVDAKGNITALKAGSVTITATSHDGSNISDMITLTIRNKGDIPVEKLTIKKDNTTMYVGGNMTLSVTVEPSNATDKNITFTSSDPSIATVDAGGKVTALKEGTVAIAATCDNVSDTITITISKANVTVAPIKVPSTTVLINQTMQASTTVSPAGTAVSWSSSNEAAARIDSKGVITGVGVGQTTITATAGTVKQSIVIYVKKPTVKWNVTYKTCPLQIKKSTTALKAIGLQPGDKIISYKSSNKKYVTVSKKGKITAKKIAGKTAKITVKTQYGATATITIKTQKAPVKVTNLTVNKTKVTLKKGKTFQLEVTKKYITSLYKVKYTSSNKKVATVSSKGKIKAKKKGKATITIKCQNKTKKVKVTVK